MASPHDIAFGGAAVKQRMLTAEQVNLGTKAQKIVAELGIPKCLAVIAVEAGWMELGQALTLVTGLRKLGVEHPEVKPREASDADEAVLDRLPPAARKRLETASRALAALFYARGAGTLALDQGSSTPPPAKRVKPAIIERPAPPPRKSGALGAILAGAAAIAAVIALLILNRGKPPSPPEVDEPPVAVKPPSPPPRAPGPPPPPPPPKTAAETPSDANPNEPSTDAGVEAKRKQYLEEQEREAANRLEEIRQLLKEGRPFSARGKLKQILGEFGWTEFVKSHADEIARLVKEAETETSSPDPEMPADEPVAEGPALPALAAAFKRLDDGAEADVRRASGAKTRLAGWKSDLALRGGKVVKGAEVVDVSREDVRVRGELEGAKVDLLLTWAALDAPSFLAVQKQISKGQGAAGLFELGRAAILRGLWKEARSAFDDCARADAAWKPRLPDIADLLSDPSVLRGAARRLGDGRILVDYSFTDADQASDLTPVGNATGAAAAGAGALKLSAKDFSMWSLRDLTFNGDIDVCFEFEGPGDLVIGFGPPGDGPRSLLYFGPSGLRIDQPDAPVQSPVAAATTVKIERRGTTLRILQGGRLLGPAAVADGPRKLLVGARGEATIKALCVSGFASAAETARRLGPLERLEGGAHAGDFRLDIPPPDSESLSRATMAEAALEAGLLEEAWTLAEEAAAKSPGAGLPIAIRALIRLAQGELRLAVADADLALALDPGSGDVAMRARRVLASVRGSGASGAVRSQAAGPWIVRTDGSQDRLAHFAAKLEEAAKGFAEALKEAGPAPQGIQVTIFTSREALFAHLESAAREPAIADLPGAEPDLLRQAAQAYIRKASIAAPAWFEAGMASHLVADRRHEDMKDLLAQAAPLEALVRKAAADFTEADRVQSASLVRFLLGGAYKSLIPDLLKKLRHGVPAIEVFSGHNLKKMDAEWRTAVEKGAN